MKEIIDRLTQISKEVSICEIGKFAGQRSRLPESRAAPRTLPWADGRSNKYYGSWRCNTGTVAVAFQSRTVSRTRLGRHNCPCPSCIVQNPRKTNTTVYVALGPVRVSAIRANGLGWLCHLLVSLRALYSVTSGQRDNVTIVSRSLIRTDQMRHATCWFRGTSLLNKSIIDTGIPSLSLSLVLLMA